MRTRTRLAAGIVAGALGMTGALIATSAASAASAATGVTLDKPVNVAYHDADSFPSYLSPEYSKSGPVVIDSAVMTVRRNSDGSLVAAGRTHVLVDPGEYRVTTTVRYRTFVTTGYTDRVVVEPEDELPAAPSSATVNEAFVSGCHVTSHSAIVDDTSAGAEPGAGSGTYVGTCDVAWGHVGGASATIGTLAIGGEIQRSYSEGDNRYGWALDNGDDGLVAGARGTGDSTAVPAAFDPTGHATATQSLDHDFPIRKYSASKAVQGTWVVRRILRP